jgi:hypothetical protein
MSWEEYRNNHMREQGQLEAARALIEDANLDTAIWMGSACLGFSAEERVHVMAMSQRLTDLARIVERRMEGRHEVRDAWEWSEGVSEALSRLEQARQLHGSIVGKALARLGEHLPRQLPGSKPRRRVPAPIRPVGTSYTLSSREPKATELPPNPPMYFPSDLWPQTNLILLEAQREFRLQSQILELCKYVIAKMMPLFFEAVRAGKMTGNAVLTEHLGGMADLLHSLLVYNDPGRPASGISSLSEEARKLEERVRESDEWFALSKAVAEAHAEPTPGVLASFTQNSGETMQVPESNLTAKNRNAVGRPRKDEERELVRKLKAKHYSWKEIAAKMNADTHQDKKPEAYRALLRSRPVRTSPPEKNGQN